MWLFKQKLGVSVKIVIRIPVALPNQTTRAPEGCLTSYYTAHNYFMKLYAAENHSSSVDDNFRMFKKEN